MHAVIRSLLAGNLKFVSLSAEAVDRGPVHLAPDDMRALGVHIEVVDADERAELVTGVVREIHWRGGQARFGGIGPDGRLGGPGPVAET